MIYDDLLCICVSFRVIFYKWKLGVRWRFFKERLFLGRNPIFFYYILPISVQCKCIKLKLNFLIYCHNFLLIAGRFTLLYRFLYKNVDMHRICKIIGQSGWQLHFCKKISYKSRGCFIFFLNGTSGRIVRY